jgi:hypothetical protein
MFTISNARKLNKGALRGFFDVELPSGLKLNGCTLIEKADGKRFVRLPSKEFVKADGTKSYTPVVDIRTGMRARSFRMRSCRSLNGRCCHELRPEASALRRCRREGAGNADYGRDPGPRPDA